MMFSLLEEQEIKVRGGRGRTRHPFPGERELDLCVCRKCFFFLLGACKGVLW